MSLYQRLLGHARFQPDKIAIDNTEGKLSYHQLHSLVERAIDYFDSLNLAPGDRVAILALNHSDWFVTLFAAARCGIILVPMNWRLSVDELRYLIVDCQPRLLLHDSEFADIAAQLLVPDVDLGLALIAAPEFPPLKNTEHSETETGGKILTSVDNEENPLLIVYTSGTTGRPKGAVLTQRALLCSAAMSQHMLDLSVQDRVLNVLPLFHVGGLNIQPLPALLYGATLILHSRFDPDAAVASIADDRITLVNSVPTILHAIVTTASWPTADLTSLRAISVGSTDVPLTLIRKIHQRGIPLIQVYGATETAPVAIYQRIEHAHLEGSIGRAGLLCDIRLRSSNGDPVAPGESGELQVKGVNVLSYYWNNTQATADSLVDGWFATGDIAHQDKEGFYWFDDRVKHVVISGGENIYPAEIERLIRELPGVAEIAVVGKRDERWGEVPVAVIVKAGAVDERLIKEACEEACGQVARFKRPRKIYFVESLPRNALGKIQMQRVKQLVADL